ncbi:hypothetical protein J001_00978 [Cryptococcus neoformans]|nr:hypothetical protein J001_00978 [Cryptococcus neoformans var. grubii]
MLLFHPSISTLPHATQAPAPKSPTTIKSVAYTANLRWPAHSQTPPRVIHTS